MVNFYGRLIHHFSHNFYLKIMIVLMPGSADALHITDYFKIIELVEF